MNNYIIDFIWKIIIFIYNFLFIYIYICTYYMHWSSLFSYSFWTAKLHILFKISNSTIVLFRCASYHLMTISDTVNVSQCIRILFKEISSSSLFPSLQIFLIVSIILFTIYMIFKSFCHITTFVIILIYA